MATAIIKPKHTREVDELDKYFIVKIESYALDGGFIIAEIGWIEKEFNENLFRQEVTEQIKNLKFNIAEVLEFEDVKEYQKNIKL